MKKQVSLLILLSVSMGGSVMTQNATAERIKKSTIEQLEKVKLRLNKELDELKKCVQKDQSCDPLRKRIYITMAVVGALAIAIGTGAGIGYLIKQNKLSLLKFLPQEYVQQQIEEIQKLAADGIERAQNTIDLFDEGQAKKDAQQLLQELQDVHEKISQESTIEGKIALLKQMQELQQKVNTALKSLTITKPSQVMQRRKGRIARKEQLEKLVAAGEQRKTIRETQGKAQAKQLEKFVHEEIVGIEQSLKETPPQYIDPEEELYLNQAKNLYAQAQKESDLRNKKTLLQQADDLLEQRRKTAMKSIEFHTAQLFAMPEEEEVEPEYKEFATGQIGYTPTGERTIRPSVANIARAAELREQKIKEEAVKEAERLKKK